MSRHDEISINWERTIDKKTARCIGPENAPRRPARFKDQASLKYLAMAKLFDVKMVGAEFAGEPELWHWTIKVLRECNGLASFLGIYADTDSRRICVRSGDWSQERDLKTLANVTDPYQYLVSGPQVDVRVTFSQSPQQEFWQLLEETAALFGKGIRPRTRAPEGASPFTMRWAITDPTSYATWDFQYGCHVEPVLDELEEKWWALSRRICEHSIVPDNGCRLSYEPSIWDRLDRFGP